MSSKRNIFIIFGTTRGLGLSLYNYAVAFPENDFILVNRRTIVGKDTERIKHIHLDLSKPISEKALTRFFSFLSRAHQYNNVFFVCNAGTIDPIRSVGMLLNEEIKKAFYTNVINYTILINKFISWVKINSNNRNRVLVVSSGAADSPQHGLSIYCATKSALETLVRSIFIEQQVHKVVEILAVRPGVIDTGMQTRIRQSTTNDLPKVQTYRSLKKESRLASPQKRATQIYNILAQQKKWSQPVLNLD